MAKFSFIGNILVATAIALFVQALGAPAQAGKNVTSVVLSPADYNAAPTLAKRSFWTSDPAQGPYLKRFPNENVRVRTQPPSSGHGYRLTVVNQAGETLWLWIETTIDGANKVSDPNRSEEKFLRLTRGESVQMGNLPSHTGTIRAYARCTENGEGCAGELGAATKWEWTTDPSGHKGNVGINLSLVDGYNIGGEMSFGQGSNCRTIRCTIPQDHLRAICPVQNLVDHGQGYASCRSDCRTKGDDYSCCTNSWSGVGICQPTSNFFSQACPSGYAWPHDHAGHYQDCDSKGEVVLRLQPKW